MVTFVALTSHKGGVGTTTTSINLASAFATFKRNVLVIDLHLKKPNVGIYLGFEQPKHTVHSALQKKHPASHAIQKHHTMIQVLPGSLDEEDLKKSFEKEDIEEVFSDLVHSAEIALVDTPSETSDEKQHILDVCDRYIFVTTPDYMSLIETQRGIREFKGSQKKILGIVVTQYKNEIPLIEMQEMFGSTKIIGAIPYDEQVKRAEKARHPLPYVDFNSPASIAYKKLAANIMGERYEHKTENQSTFRYFTDRMGFTDPK